MQKPRRVWLWAVLGLCLLLAASRPWWPRPPIAPEVIEALVADAVLEMETGHAQAAAALLDKALEADPRHGSALLYRGQLCMEAGDLETAISYWRRVPDEPPTARGTACYLEGAARLERDQARQAERLFHEAVARHPAYLQPHERLLGLYVVQQRREDLLRELAAIQRLRPWTLDELVMATVPGPSMRANRTRMELLEGFVRADASDLYSRLALARSYLEKNQLDEAKQLLDQMQAKAPRDERVRALLIDARLKDEQYAAARALLEESPPGPDAHARLWQSYGDYALAVGAWERAAECFAFVVQREPDDRSARYRLGTALQQAGRREEAEEHLRHARELDRLEAQALRVMRGSQERTDLLAPLAAEVGELLARHQRHVEAVAWLDVALAITPRDAAGAALRPRWQQLRNTSRQLAESSATRQDVPTAAESRAAKISAARAAAAKTAGGRLPAAADRDGAPATGEEAVPRLAMRDVHAAARIDFQYFNGESGFKYIIESTGGGVAVGDFDNDTWPDLFFPQGCALPFDSDNRTHTDRLFRNGGQGVYADVTRQAGVGGNGYGQGCTAADFNNDGFTDLVVANFGQNRLYQNQGDGTFLDVTGAAGVAGDRASSSTALADLNRDGNLDLYVVNYVQDPLRVCRDREGVVRSCSPRNFVGAQDALYLSRGDGTFDDVTEAAGVVAPDGKGLGIVIADLDDDRWPDIYVANDAAPNFLFRNQARPELRFREEGLFSGTALNGDGSAEGGMGVACADLDGDQRPDLYVTNFFDETNTLYLNQGEALFRDATASSGFAASTLPLLGFGTQPLDVDLDGRPELFVANGHVDDFRFRNQPWKMPPQFFYNRGGGRFQDVSSQLGDYFGGEYLGRGVARLDWNRDGRGDLVVVHQDRPAALLQNETPATGNRVVLELRGVTSNRDGIGARIRVTAGDRVQTLQICGGDGYFASNERLQIVGVGTAASIDAIDVDWPNGLSQRQEDVPVNTRLLWIEGRPPIVRRLADNEPG